MYIQGARPQRICLARPWKHLTSSASPRSRETPVGAALVVARPAKDAAERPPCMQLDGSRLTGTRAGALPALPRASFQCLALSGPAPAPTPSSLAAPPAHRPIQASQSPAGPESPSLQVSKFQVYRTRKSKPGWHPVDEPGPASAHPSDSFSG